MMRVLWSLIYLAVYVVIAVTLREHLTLVAPTQVATSITILTGLMTIFAIFAAAMLIRNDIIDALAPDALTLAHLSPEGYGDWG